jgi:hypothetical protein
MSTSLGLYSFKLELQLTLLGLYLELVSKVLLNQGKLSGRKTSGACGNTFIVVLFG